MWQRCLYGSGVRGQPAEPEASLTPDAHLAIHAMTTHAPLTLEAQAGATPISFEQFRQFFGETIEDKRGELVTRGPWQLPVTFRAVAISCEWGEFNFLKTITLYGQRNLSNAKQEHGYCLSGTVSIGGIKRRGFTSTQLWQLPDGQLIETAVIHASGN